MLNKGIYREPPKPDSKVIKDRVWDRYNSVLYKRHFCATQWPWHRNKWGGGGEKTYRLEKSQKG